MRDLCGDASARGCTGFVGLDLHCTCRCVNGLWYPRPWIIVAGVRVYVAMDCDGPAATFFEEQRHVDLMQRDLDKENRRALGWTRMSFNSEGACRFGCDLWKSSTLTNLYDKFGSLLNRQDSLAVRERKMSSPLKRYAALLCSIAARGRSLIRKARCTRSND